MDQQNLLRYVDLMIRKPQIVFNLWLRDPDPIIFFDCRFNGIQLVTSDHRCELKNSILFIVSGIGEAFSMIVSLGET